MMDRRTVLICAALAAIGAGRAADWAAVLAQGSGQRVYLGLSGQFQSSFALSALILRDPEGVAALIAAERARLGYTRILRWNTTERHKADFVAELLPALLARKDVHCGAIYFDRREPWPDSLIEREIAMRGHFTQLLAYGANALGRGSDLNYVERFDGEYPWVKDKIFGRIPDRQDDVRQVRIAQSSEAQLAGFVAGALASRRGYLDNPHKIRCQQIVADYLQDSASRMTKEPLGRIPFKTVMV